MQREPPSPPDRRRRDCLDSLVGSHLWARTDPTRCSLAPTPRPDPRGLTCLKGLKALTCLKGLKALTGLKGLMGLEGLEGLMAQMGPIPCWPGLKGLKAQTDLIPCSLHPPDPRAPTDPKLYLARRPARKLCLLARSVPRARKPYSSALPDPRGR